MQGLAAHAELPRRLVVEGEVAVAAVLAHGARQRGLAALAGAMDEHDRRVGQGLAQAGCQVAAERLGCARHV